MFSEAQQFTIPEILSLIGLAQSLYVLVYMGFRAGEIKRAILPFLYFLVLGTAFFLDFASRFLADIGAVYSIWQWAVWFTGPPLAVLLVIQIAQISRLPSWPNFFLLVLIPMAWFSARTMAGMDSSCSEGLYECHLLYEWLVVAGLIAGLISLLTIWLHRGLLGNLHADKKAGERYWLILMVIIVNVAFLLIMLLSLTPAISWGMARIIRTVLGVGLVYLAGTSLFRIYPQAIKTIQRTEKTSFSKEEEVLAQRITDLLEFEKVYQEPSYSRSDLARELETSETTISKVINDYFGKSLPTLLNERRVRDAKQLLVETDAAVSVIAGDVGFNSSSSFNRVFRDETGLTPTQFRNKNTINSS